MRNVLYSKKLEQYHQYKSLNIIILRINFIIATNILSDNFKDRNSANGV